MPNDFKMTSSEVFPPSRFRFGVDRFWFWAGLGVAALILGCIALFPLQAEVFNQEGGLIETISAAGLFTAGVVALVKYRGLARLYIGVGCLLLAERELEADIYAEGSVPFAVLSGLDGLLDMTLVRVALAVVVLGGVLWHGIPNAWRAVRVQAPFLAIFVLAGLAAVVAQGLEEISGLYEATMSSVMKTRLFVLEETLEMYFSIGILASVLIGWPKEPTDESLHDPDSARGEHPR